MTTAHGRRADGSRDRLDHDVGGWPTIARHATETIVRGDERVAAADVEAVCAALPGVRRVAVVGYPDERLGQRVGLVVASDRPPTTEEVRAHCLAAGLTPSAVPDRVFVLEPIPTLPTGRLDRAVLAELLSGC